MARRGCCLVAHSVYCYYDDVVSSASFSLFIISVWLCFSSCLAVSLWAMRFHNIHRRFRRMQRVWARLDSTRPVSVCECECELCALFNFDFISCNSNFACWPDNTMRSFLALLYCGWQPKAMRTLLQTADRHMLMGSPFYGPIVRTQHTI